MKNTMNYFVNTMAIRSGLHGDQTRNAWRLSLDLKASTKDASDAAIDADRATIARRSWFFTKNASRSMKSWWAVRCFDDDLTHLKLHAMLPLRWRSDGSRDVACHKVCPLITSLMREFQHVLESLIAWTRVHAIDAAGSGPTGSDACAAATSPVK